MRFRYINFIENWIAKNITAVDDYGTPERAEELAVKLKSDALAKGITPDEDAAVSGDLVALIYKTMHHGFDPALLSLEVQVARIRRGMDLLLEMLNDLRSYNTIIGQWRDGKLVDMTNEWIAECEMNLHQGQKELESALERNRWEGSDLAG